MEAMQLKQAQLVWIISHHRAALDGGHVFVRVEAEHHDIAEGANVATLPARTDGMRCILDHTQTMLARQSVQRVHVERMTGKMHRHDGAGAWRDGRFDRRQIDVPRVQIHVHEHGSCTHASDDIGRGHKTHGGRDHFIARLDADHQQRQFQARSGRGQRPYRAAATELGKLPLQLLHLRAAGQPARTQHLRHRLHGCFVDIRASERKEFHDTASS